MGQYNETSFAKINLFLRVVGKDEQGYHMLESYFALLNFGDRVSVKKSASLKCITKHMDINEENIVLRAFKEIKKHGLELSPVEIEIDKRIPIAAGMGGGSANAASAIRLINRLYNLNLSIKGMAEAAYNIGADVPFFIYNQNAFVSGRGERILPLKLNISLPILLIYPQINISTKDVYKQSVRSFSNSLKDITTQTIIDKIYYGKNDLMLPAISLAPQVLEVINILAKQDGCITSRMSGSGSTCFGIFKDEEKAKQALQNLKKSYPNFWYHYELLML